MDPASFSTTHRGVVRRTLEGYHAYFPGPLPRRLELDADSVLALDQATGAVHRLAGVGRRLPNPRLLVAPHTRIEAVFSSRIEGTRTTAFELLRAEAEPGLRLAGDVLEVSNYVAALEHGIARLRDGFPLSLRLLREVHERLVRGVRGGLSPGDFRTTQNWIGPPGCTLDSATFVPPPPAEMLDDLADLERFLHEDGLPLLVRIGLAHYQFEAIHPFVDGNGRVGRLLIPLVLLDRGVLEHPLLYVSAVLERRRQDYYALLLTTSQSGDVVPWLRFFLSAVEEAARDAEERVVRLVDLLEATRTELLDARATTNVIRLAELLFARPVVTAAIVGQELGVSAPTATAALRQLQERGLVEELTGHATNRVYAARGVMDAVYGGFGEA